MEHNIEWPPSPLCLRSEVVFELHEIRQYEIVEPQVDINPHKVNNFLNNPRELIEQVVMENRALRKMGNNNELIVQHLQ